MPGFTAKFDRELAAIYRSHVALMAGTAGERVHPAAVDDVPVELLLQYVGDLAEIEARGLVVTSRQGRSIARGRIELADLEAVASHAGVLALEYGEIPEVDLVDAVVHVGARSPDQASGGLWQFDDGSGDFTGPTGSSVTGLDAPVVIGIIDTGIDLEHPDFRRPDGHTRIRRLWDMGRDPEAGAQAPPVDLLDGTTSYGVHYTDVQIDAFLQGDVGAINIGHKDCSGHGTSVASAAAGRGHMRQSGQHQIGVAPGADLVVVKLMHLESAPANIGHSAMLADAVTYIEKVAADVLDGRPVVINYSVGGLGSGDGLGTQEAWLRDHFDGAVGRIFVTSAGNSGSTTHPLDDGGRAGRMRAIVTMPASGSVDIPLDLYDVRGSVTSDWDSCVSRSNFASGITVSVWYAPPSGTGTISGTLTGPSAFNSLSVNAPLVDRDERSGPLGVRLTGWAGHQSTQVGRPVGDALEPVTRHELRFTVAADPPRDRHISLTGRDSDMYTLSLSGPAGHEVNVVCAQHFQHGLALARTVPAGVNVTSASTLSSPMAANTLTAAAYDHTTGQIADFSSRGPMVDYSGYGPLLQKPDISAPGVSVQVARSRHARGTVRRGYRLPLYASASGTSFSAPIVSGIVALLLEKSPNLTPQTVLEALQNNVQAGSLPVTEHGAGRVNAQAAHETLPLLSPGP